MARDIDILAAAGAGPRLIARRPLAVFVWGLLVVALLATAGLALWSSFAELVADPQPQSEGPGASLAQSLRLQMLAAPLNGLSLLAQGVLGAAAFRAVLSEFRPDRFLYLRLGKAELLLIVVQVALGFGLWIALVVPGLIVGGVTFAVWSLSPAAGTVVLVIGAAAMLALAIWLLLRVSLIAPMTVADERLRFVEGWRLARGRVPALLGVGALTWLMLLGVQVVVTAAMASVFWAGPAPLDLALEQPSRLALLLAVAAPPASLVIGVVLALSHAPWAETYRQLAASQAGADAGTDVGPDAGPTPR